MVNHSLKLGTIVGLGRIGAVNIGSDNINAILSGKRCVFSDLSLNRLFALVIRGIACIDNASHHVPPFGFVDKDYTI